MGRDYSQGGDMDKGKTYSPGRVKSERTLREDTQKKIVEKFGDEVIHISPWL